MDTDSPIPLAQKNEPSQTAAPAIAPPIAPPPPATHPAVPPRSVEKGSWGGLIGIVIIVGLILAAAFYSWGERIARHESQERSGTGLELEATI